MTRAVEFASLVDDARALARSGGRRILGITGVPGSGKSTLAEALVEALGDEAALVSLDGFHLANAELRRLGRYERKGAPDTFDAAGYVNLLRRLRQPEGDVVYAAVFDRELEESLACATPLATEVPLIITEGNYLLMNDDAWGEVRQLIDDCWYVDLPKETRMERLIARHMRFGRSYADAYARSYGSDQCNAELINTTRGRADRVVHVQMTTGLAPASNGGTV
jgi:pantothenate kinase